MQGKFHELYWRATARSFSGLNHEEKRLNGNERIALGDTQLSVSRLCFGTSALGDMPDTYNYVVDEERALSTIRAIFESPVNFLDTSRIYGHGRSEQRIGKVIQELGGLPDDFVISTKIDRNWETNKFDASQARRSLEESLQALGLEKLQLVHLHDPEYASSLEDVTGTNGALRELCLMKEEGLVEAAGLAAGKVDTMMPILRNWEFDVIVTHNRFTLLNRNAEEMIEFAKEKGIAVLNAAPYASGVLAKGSTAYPQYVYMPADDSIIELTQKLEIICNRFKIPLGALALQFSVRDPRILSTVCGISKPERISETLQWLEWDIPPGVWEELDSFPSSKEDPEASRVYNSG